MRVFGEEFIENFNNYSYSTFIQPFKLLWEASSSASDSNYKSQMTCQCHVLPAQRTEHAMLICAAFMHDSRTACRFSAMHTCTSAREIRLHADVTKGGTRSSV